MIRVATFDEFDAEALKQLSKILYQSFGVGTELVGAVDVPSGLGDPLDPVALLEKAPKVQAFQDDKVLYLTQQKLASRKLATGEAPTLGLSQYNGQRALVTASHIKNLPDNVKQLARYALQELGHTWGLHHCLDPRCAMYPHWTPSYPAGDSSFCVFCREMSEQKIRLAKS